MIKNRYLKKFLKNSVFKVLNIVNAITPKSEKNIIFYSPNMGIEHNLLPLRDYLLRHNYNQKYKIICGVSNKKYKDINVNNVIFTTPLKSILTYFFSKHIFYTTGQIPIKPSKKQNVVQLGHGASQFKTMGKLSKINNGDEYYFNHILVTSDIYIPIVVKEFECEKQDAFICGEPMVDAFYQETSQINLGNYDKVILWAPTFRRSDYLGYDDSSLEELLILFSEEEYDELNENLKQYNFLLIVKLHPGQNTNGWNKIKLSNLIIYSHKAFLEENLNLYKLLPQIDVLLADYSSVYLQFLLLNKPIGFVVPDMEEYAEKRGFVFENPKDYMPGEIIKSKVDMYHFLSDIYKGIDKYKDKREQVRDLVHKYQDGNNCKRILQRFGITLDKESE